MTDVQTDTRHTLIESDYTRIFEVKLWEKGKSWNKEGRSTSEYLATA